MVGIRRFGRVTAFVATITLLMVGPSYAGSEHFNSWDSVDGGEIRYENYTQYSDSLYWGRDRWNFLGSVNIAADTAGTVTDLEVRDYNQSDGLCGKASPQVGADLMFLNINAYSGYSTDKRRACTLHEFGHTLRLDHSFATQAMDPSPVSSNPTFYITPQGHDQVDYHALWG